jgi:hypothetical protein
VKGIEFHNINLSTAKPDERPAFVLDSVSGADFDFIKAPHADGALPLFQLKAVDKFSLHNCPDLESKNGSFTNLTRF